MLGPRASAPVRPRLLLVADLDKTMFNTHKKEVTWIGDETFWLDTFSGAHRLAMSQGFDVVFAVVTNKPNFDDICETAARVLRPFFQIANPAMYTQLDDGAIHCLAYVMGKYYLECVEQFKSMQVKNPNGLVSNFIVQGELDHLGQINLKSSSILDLARIYGIPPQHCILLDDTPCVVQDAKANLINTVGFECFNTDPQNPSRIHPDKLDDLEYVWSELLKKRRDLFSEIVKIARYYEQAMINQMFATGFTPHFQYSNRTESRYAAFFRESAQRQSAATATSAASSSSTEVAPPPRVLHHPKPIRLTGDVNALEILAHAAARKKTSVPTTHDKRPNRRF